jgi:hypothetical protein
MRAAGLVGTLPPSRTLRDLRDIAWHAPDLKLQRTLRSQVRPLRTAHGASYPTLHRERIGVTDTCGLRRTESAGVELNCNKVPARRARTGTQRRV